MFAYFISRVSRVAIIDPNGSRRLKGVNLSITTDKFSIVSVHFVSSRAYEYLREKCGYHKSSGIRRHALDALQAKTEEMISKKKKQLLISLVFDEMSI